jgi:hypothetical protein
MTDEELDVLEQIWEGKTSWGPEWEETLDNLAADGYIEIIEKRQKSQSAQKDLEGVLVRITDEGVGHLSGSAY